MHRCQPQLLHQNALKYLIATVIVVVVRIGTVTYALRVTQVALHRETVETYVMGLLTTRAVESAYPKEYQIRSWIATTRVSAKQPLIVAVYARVAILERWRIT